MFSAALTLRPTEVSANFIHIPSLVHHGVLGKSLLLPVETQFQLDEAEIQGTWSHTAASGVRTTLVAFTKDSSITDMMRQHHLLFREPNASLLIRKLKQQDEGDYHLNLNVQFYNRSGEMFHEERTLHVTVDGESPSRCMLSYVQQTFC